MRLTLNQLLISFELMFDDGVVSYKGGDKSFRVFTEEFIKKLLTVNHEIHLLLCSSCRVVGPTYVHFCIYFANCTEL